jgi:hypothetical protein
MASHENAAEYPKHPTNRSIVNVRVRPIQIAQRLLNPMMPRLAHHPGMFGKLGSFQRDGQPQLEWHIESGGSRRAVVQLNPGKIVYGVFAIANQHQNAIQPSLTGWDFKGSSGSESECTHGCDVGQKEVFKRGVVGDVQKNRLCTSRATWWFSSWLYASLPRHFGCDSFLLQ